MAKSDDFGRFFQIIFGGQGKWIYHGFSKMTDPCPQYLAILLTAMNKLWNDFMKDFCNAQKMQIYAIYTSCLSMGMLSKIVTK